MPQTPRMDAPPSPGLQRTDCASAAGQAWAAYVATWSARMENGGKQNALQVPETGMQSSFAEQAEMGSSGATTVLHRPSTQNGINLSLPMTAPSQEYEAVGHTIIRQASLRSRRMAAKFSGVQNPPQQSRAA